LYSWEPTLTEEKRKDLHETVMKLGQERETGTTHELSEDQLRTVLATADFFTQDGYTDQVKFDLVNARYKIYDWIAMLLDGRDDGNERLTQVMASAYIRATDVEGFIQNLRRKDYQIEKPKLEPISQGEKTGKTKRELIEENARGNPKIDGEKWFSEVYGAMLPIEAVKGLCPRCKEPIMDDAKMAEIEDWNTIDQDLATEKTNYCGYCGFESNDNELIT